MDPALALPSYRIYRGSLLALLIGTVLAVWLLLRPVGGSNLGAPPALAGTLSTATARPAASTTPVSGPTGSATPTSSATATPTRTASATPTATPARTGSDYTVKPGDTLFSIADAHLPPGKDTTTYANDIQKANGISDPGALSVGQTIRLP